MRILVAEDDRNILNGIVEVLRTEGYDPVTAEDGEQALAVYRRSHPDFVCLDIMMPKLSGYDVCREIRSVDRNVPIMFLSAKSEEIDRVLGLELGADDYLMKPFGVRELVARVRAVSRRSFRPPSDPDAAFFLDDVEVIPAKMRAIRDRVPIELSLREMKILQLFFEMRGKVIDRDTLFSRCWGIDHYPNSRTIDQHIAKLRKKIERTPNRPEILETVHGVGYRYEDGGRERTG